MAIKVFTILLALFLTTAILQVQCQSHEDVAAAGEASDLGIVGDDTHVFSDVPLGSATGVDTACVFPKNAGKLVPVGEETELLVGLNNEGESSLNVITIHASLHLPFNHHILVQNLTAQEFYNASVPVSAQATFPYLFAVSKYLQSGSFDLVASIVYEVDHHRYQNVFYNGTIEAIEAGGFISTESVFLGTFGIALLVLSGLWAYGQIQQFSKKTKRSPKVEVGTRTTKADMDEWLQGTAYAQSLLSQMRSSGPQIPGPPLVRRRRSLVGGAARHP